MRTQHSIHKQMKSGPEGQTKRVSAGDAMKTAVPTIHITPSVVQMPFWWKEVAKAFSSGKLQSLRVSGHGEVRVKKLERSTVRQGSGECQNRKSSESRNRICGDGHALYGRPWARPDLSSASFAIFPLSVYLEIQNITQALVLPLVSSGPALLSPTCFQILRKPDGGPQESLSVGLSFSGLWEKLNFYISHC